MHAQGQPNGHGRQLCEFTPPGFGLVVAFLPQRDALRGEGLAGEVDHGQAHFAVTVNALDESRPRGQVACRVENYLVS